MSFFAYLNLITTDVHERQILVQVLMDTGYLFKEVALAQEFGVNVLYGVDVPLNQLFEVELIERRLSDGTVLDLEAALLDPEDTHARWQHYQACAQHLGRQVSDFHEDKLVDQLYRATPIDLGVVTLLRVLATTLTARPLILNLDPDFEARFGHVQVLRGLAEIRTEVWKATAFRDLQEPLRLVLD